MVLCLLELGCVPWLALRREVSTVDRLFIVKCSIRKHSLGAEKTYDPILFHHHHSKRDAKRVNAGEKCSEVKACTPA